MNFSSLFQETWEALASNRIRTGLTMLGIVIGIASVISMVALGNGAQQSITSSIESIGSNLIMVMPGMQRGVGTAVSQGQGSATSLTIDDADAIAGIEGVIAVAPEKSGRYQITVKGANTNTQVVGTTPEYASARNISLEAGTFFSSSQVSGRARVAVLGSAVREDLFGTESVAEDAIGVTIRIKGIECKIIGVTVAKGSGGMGSQDDMVFMPITTAQQYLAGSDSVSTVNVAAETSDSMAVVQEEIIALLLERHGINDVADADFRIMNQADIVSMASSVTSTFTLLLGAVAGISLLVGGIGIMNMMLTTVSERTHEIGLRKAIGARRADINRQFLAESIVLTVLGGVIGILLGVGVSVAISSLGIMQSSVSIGSVLLALTVSCLIGVGFGYYPARRASALNPIEALRYE